MTGTATHETADREAASAALAVRNLHVRYGGTNAVDGVSLEVGAGCRTAIIGPNGAGKSSLVNAATGFVRPSGGQIWLGGKNVTRWSSFRRARHGLGRTFQNLESFTTLTVRESLLVAFEAAGHPNAGHPDAWRRRWSERSPRRSIVGDLLAQTGLASVADRQVGLLPYGARKLVEIGRALAGQPKVLLLDEPAAGLDTREKAEFIDRLEALVRSAAVSVLLIEHDMPTVRQMCPDHVVVMDAGIVIAEGTFREVISDERVIEAYLGRARTHPDDNSRIDN